jgi:hypothetical protein
MKVAAVRVAFYWCHGMTRWRRPARGSAGTLARSSTTRELLGRYHYLKIWRRELRAVAHRKGASVMGRHWCGGALVKGCRGVTLEGLIKH